MEVRFLPSPLNLYAAPPHWIPMTRKAEDVADNVIRVDPDSLVYDDSSNSRKVSSENIKIMAASLGKEGQLQPVIARRMEDGKLKVVVGNTRGKAMILHNEAHPKERMKLDVKVIPEGMTDAQAYRMSVVENHARNNPNAVEIAKQQKRLMEEFGHTAKEVAGIFYPNKGASGEVRVASLQKLFELPAETRKLVETRQLPVQAAIEMVDLPAKEQTEILAAAERINGRIKGESVRAKVKKKKRDAGEALARTIKEVIGFCEGLQGPAEDKPVRNLAAKMEAFVRGELSLEAAERAFRSLGGATDGYPRPKPEPEPEAEAAEEKAPAKKKTKKAKAPPKSRNAKKAPAAKKAKKAKAPKADSTDEPEPIDDEEMEPTPEEIETEEAVAV